MAVCLSTAASASGSKTFATSAPSAESQQSSALPQTGTSTASGVLTDEEDGAQEMGELGVPKHLEPELMQLAEKEGGKAGVKMWLDLKHAYTGYSIAPHDAVKVFDGDDNTWGGAQVWIFDLGRQYIVDTMSINWRVCKCTTPGSVEIGAASDLKFSWTTWLRPTLEAWGDKVKRTYMFHKSARYIAIRPTSKANPAWVGFWNIAVYAAADMRKIPNHYGWYQSYTAGNQGFSGTEIVHLYPYKGKLFAGTGYWKHVGAFRPAEILRLDCSMCDWVLESPVAPWAGRVESLRSVTWTTDRHGSRLPAPMDALMAGYYMDMQGTGECHIVKRDDAFKTWADSTYWRRTPFNTTYLSARAFILYHDPVTKTDGLFLSSGMDGIIRGWYEPNSPAWAHFGTASESGAVATRPLGLTICDAKLYFTASSILMKRNNGLSPSWSKVFDMADHDTKGGTVDEAIGGIRGISTISNPAVMGGQSLLFAWAPNAASAGCMIRLDPDGNGFKWTQEKCARDAEIQYFGKNHLGLPAIVTFMIANYNSVLEVPKPDGGVVHLIGFQALLYGYSYYEISTDPTQSFTASSGKPLSYYVGAGYMIRKSAHDYDVRTPGGPRWDPMAVFPKQVAVRTLSTSPFGDHAIFVGGYDCNHFDSKDTAWVQRGSAGAAYADPVPCQPELGCGHVWGQKFRVHGCDWCDQNTAAGGSLDLPAVAAWKGKQALTCQALINWLNGPGKSQCTAAKSWIARDKCCRTNCDICGDVAGQFDPAKEAGQYPDGKKYSCQVAADYLYTNPKECLNGRKWWAAACCF